jgi:hypothetical protein
VKNVIIGDGSWIKEGSNISNSIIGLRSLIGENCDIQDTLMLGSDYYETLDECAFVPGCLPMGIGSGSVVRKTLIDKNARIGENVKILNKEGVVENFSTESKGWIIRDGIVVSVCVGGGGCVYGCVRWLAQYFGREGDSMSITLDQPLSGRLGSVQRCCCPEQSLCSGWWKCCLGCWRQHVPAFYFAAV